MSPETIFSAAPSVSALAYTARVVRAAYSHDISGTMSWLGRNPRLLAAGPPPLRTWAWDWDGKVCVAITGTTLLTQYPQFTAGESLPVQTPEGQYNRFVVNLANQLYPLLPNDTYMIAGHSLGGAVATVLSRRMKEAGLPVGGAVTFGGPRPTDQLASQSVGWPPVVNVDAVGDPIPMYPHASLAATWLRPGRTFNLTPIKLTETIEATYSPLSFWNGVTDLATHSMDNYVKLLGPNPVPPAAQRANCCVT